MSDSSTEAPATQEKGESQTGTQKEPKMVPVEALAKERGEKRAARAEADTLRQEREQQGTIDAALIEQLAVQARAAVERELEPERQRRQEVEQENARLKLRMDFGLNEEQSKLAMDFHSKHKDLTIGQSLMLLRAENPSIFPMQASQQYSRGVPVTGDSLARAQSSTEDHTKLMHDARQKGDLHTAQRHAALEFERRFQGLKSSARTT